jgi:Flp pilus assembly protein TadD
LFEELGRFGEARSIYLKSLESFSDVAEIYFRLGFTEGKLGDEAACFKAMRKAVELEPNHAEALNYLAYSYAEKGENLIEALDMAMKANAIKPDNGYIVDTLAWVYFVSGDLVKALPLLERAVSLSKEDPVILEHLGDALLKSGRPQEAKRAYERALEKGYENPGVLNEKLNKIGN